MAAIILLAPTSNWGRMVDRATGSMGWSHVLLDAGEEDDDGIPLWWDCTPAKGIHRVRATQTNYSRRDSARIELQPADSIFVWRCATVCQGRNYSTKDSCASWVIRCLPQYLEVFCEAVAERYKMPLSPNVLAIAFGISEPGETVVIGSDGSS